MADTKKVQIVATIGPSSESKEVLRELLSNGMNFMRLNFSWGTHEEHFAKIKNLRGVALEMGMNIPVIQDLSGPREQTADGHGFNHSSVETITEKDLVDLKFGLESGVEYVAMSYVGTPEDVVKIKSEMEKIVNESNGVLKKATIITKIERAVAVENFDAILAVSDAVMIARGDLGNEVPLEQIPFVEKMIIDKCNKAGKFVITATQMMLTMKDNPYPTRAEVTDVAYAVVCGTDAVMLSEESASGKYPVKAVEMMQKIILESQNHVTDFWKK